MVLTPSFLTRQPAMLLIIASALLACGIMTGCGSPASSHPHVLRIPVTGSLIHIDPARSDTGSARFVASLLFTGLMKFSPDLHIIPELAVSIPTISSGGRTYTFTVRQDARFADGHACTAGDVAYSFARALSPTINSGLARLYLGNILGAPAVEGGRTAALSGIHVVDRLTLQIRLAHPDATFLQKLAFPVAAVVERRYAPRTLVGTGPWLLQTRERDGNVTLMSHPHFYGGSLQLRSLILVPVRDDEAALSLYRKGLVDVAHVPLDRWSSDRDRGDFHQSNSLDAYWAIPEGSGSPLLASTVNRDTVLAWANMPYLSTSTNIVPPAVPDYDSSPPTLIPPAFLGSSPAALLGRTSSDDQTLQALSRGLSHQWASGLRGQRVEIVHVWRALPDPVAWLRLVLPHTRSRWFNQILQKSVMLTNDPVGRMNLYGSAENWALQQGLVIPLASASTAFLIRSAVQGLQVTPMGLMPANDNWSGVSVT